MASQIGLPGFPWRCTIMVRCMDLHIVWCPPCLPPIFSGMGDVFFVVRAVEFVFVFAFVFVFVSGDAEVQGISLSSRTKG